MSILNELEARGQLADLTHRDELDELLGGGDPVSFYIGFDPSAISLHLGSMVPIMLMVRLQRAGHRPIVLVGGGTGMIGDPSGKSDERQLLDEETLERNCDALRAQLSRFLHFGDGPTDAIMVNNLDWLGELALIEFLRDFGKLLSVNYMIAKESVRSRLDDRDQGISYTEFSYMLLQAYDFVHLAEHFDCRLQAGGSDQWGNITAGCELQRKLGGAPVFGLTLPLLLDSTGKKMGKTAAGTNVWIDSEQTSPYALHQYLLNVADADVGPMLNTFSLRPVGEIAELVREHNEAPQRRAAQRALADELTTWIHDGDATRRATAASEVMFGGSLDELSDRDLEPLLADVPSSRLPRAELEGGVGLVDLLARTGLSKSKGEARRLVSQGGVYVNNVRADDANRSLSIADLGTESMMVVRTGKKRYHIVVVV